LYYQCTINMCVFSLILYTCALAMAIAVSRHYNHASVNNNNKNVSSSLIFWRVLGDGSELPTEHYL